MDAVSFVGSTPIARYIHETAGRHGKRVQALGGAKNHAIILPDADLDYAADQLVAAAFGSAGERCMAISAAVTVGGVGDALLEQVNAKARAIQVGSGRDAGSEMGPVVTAEARDRIERLVGTGESQGAQVPVDGRGVTVPGHEGGFFVGPTVVDQVTPDMDVYREEIFGPVLSVLRLDDVDAAIDLDQRQPLRQRHRDLHVQRRGGAPLPARRPGRHDRHQRADPGADGLLLVRRLEGLPVR